MDRVVEQFPRPDLGIDPRYFPSPPTAVLYTADDLARVKAPRLNNADRRARKTFRVAYIKYLIEHENVMRQRPPGQRVEPRAVIECMH